MIVIIIVVFVLCLAYSIPFYLTHSPQTYDCILKTVVKALRMSVYMNMYHSFYTYVSEVSPIHMCE